MSFLDCVNARDVGAENKDSQPYHDIATGRRLILLVLIVDWYNTYVVCSFRFISDDSPGQLTNPFGTCTVPVRKPGCPCAVDYVAVCGEH